MRTPEEISQAVEQLKDAFEAAGYTGDKGAMDATSTAIMALRWAMGQDNNFGRMIAEMRQVDALLERHKAN